MRQNPPGKFGFSWTKRYTFPCNKTTFSWRRLYPLGIINYISTNTLYAFVLIIPKRLLLFSYAYSCTWKSIGGWVTNPQLLSICNTAYVTEKFLFFLFCSLVLSRDWGNVLHIVAWLFVNNTGVIYLCVMDTYAYRRQNFFAIQTEVSYETKRHRGWGCVLLFAMVAKLC